MHVRSRLATRVAALGLVLGAAVVPLATQAHAATPPTLTATPSTGLADGQKITLTGTGWAPNATAYLVECSGPHSGSTCSPKFVTAQTDASGNLPSTSFTVFGGAVGDGFCPSKTGADTCNITGTTDPTDQTDTAAVGTAPISFGPFVQVDPNTNVKNNATVTVSGWGFAATKSPIYVLECGQSTGTAGSGCDTSHFVAGTTTATGAFSVKLLVHDGKVGDQTVKPGGTALINATTATASPAPPNSVGTATITFSKTQAAGPIVTKVSATAKASGSKVKVAGVIRAGGKAKSGLKVTVYERAKGSHAWKKAGSTTSHKGGAFAVSGLKHFSTTEQYIAKHAKQKVGGKVYSASSSKVSTVKA